MEVSSLWFYRQQEGVLKPKIAMDYRSLRLLLVKQQLTSTQAKQQLRISFLFTRHVSNDSIPTDRLTHSNSVMLYSTNRIKELSLRIDMFGLLTNQDFYVQLVEKKFPFLLPRMPFALLTRPEYSFSCPSNAYHAD